MPARKLQRTRKREIDNVGRLIAYYVISSFSFTSEYLSSSLARSNIKLKSGGFERDSRDSRCVILNRVELRDINISIRERSNVRRRRGKVLRLLAKSGNFVCVAKFSSSETLRSPISRAAAVICFPPGPIETSLAAAAAATSLPQLKMSRKHFIKSNCMFAAASQSMEISCKSRILVQEREVSFDCIICDCCGGGFGS